MLVEGLNKWTPSRKSRGSVPYSARVWRMNRLMRDGRAKPVLRHHILRLQRGQGNIIFPIQLTSSRIGHHHRVIHTVLKGLTIHNRHRRFRDKNHLSPMGECEQHTMTTLLAGQSACTSVQPNNTTHHTYIHANIDTYTLKRRYPLAVYAINNCARENRGEMGNPW